ncbi:tandem-95 repeat protein [Cognaticolwellia beringensis]|uniref:Cadherin domain-containing protein n=1 Tax=Cognaticolwellia beringensis TaxID=1967665 RepID=A0A222GBC3_9GAMM|nr:tandem-95 repeat protein [Cognaticolwellia beringensis]ASP48664.1 hypothetical protein B5D82_13330 [Cognaticolwellia beringensis]
MYINRCIYIIALLSLTACGGGGSESAKETSSAAPIITVPQPSAGPTIDLTGQTGTTLLVAKKVAGTESVSNSTVSTSFSNATGTLRHASSNGNVEGNLTLGVSAADTDVMNKVSLYLPNAERSFVLCSENCALDFQATITGFNPQFANEIGGSLRIELVVEDNLGNSAVVDALSVNWQPIQISAISASRENSVISVSWSGNSKLERYNLYAATEVGITSSNAIELDNGLQQLAINGTTAQFTDADPTKNYHLLVTGIDSGGESGKSVPYSIAKLGGVANLAPIANNDNYQVNEDETLNVNVLDNDVDPDGQVITLDSVTLQPFNGTLTFDDIGNFTYTPRLNFNGTDSASYRIIDAEGATAEATAIFEVLPINDNPTAVADTYGVDASGEINAADTNLLSNDSDIDGDDLQVITTAITSPQLGKVIINADGSFSYQSVGVLSENDQFEYQVIDGQGGSATATVTIVPNGNILPPTALNDTYTVDEDNTLIIGTVGSGILANDSDPNGLSFELLESLLIEPQHGQLNLALDGTFTYIPNSNFTGIDQFQYQIKNSADILAQAFVSITINPTADIPIALDDNYLTEEDVKLVVDASSGLLVNDVDFDNAQLTVNTRAVNTPQNGVLVLAVDGSFSYTPNTDFNGVDSFTYQVISSSGLTNTANVNIDVLPLNDSPIAVDDVASTNEDSSVVVDVLANDIDKEGDTLSLVSVSLENGTATIVNGKLNITPAQDFFGQINVTYVMTDNINLAETGSLLLTVLPINDAPIALDDSYSLAEDTGLTILVTDNNNLLSNDSDVDGDTLTVDTTPVASPAKTKTRATLNTQPLADVSNGNLTLNSNGSFSYIPDLNFSGVDSFTYQVMDGNGGTAQATVTLTVNLINEIPIAVDDSYSFNEDFTWVRAVTDGDQLLSNDTDGDGDTLTVDSKPVSGVSNGTLTLNTDGSFTYVPDADFFSQDSFTYKISDGKGGTAQATVTLIVHAVNDVPVVASTTKSFTFDEDSPLNKLVTDAENLLSGTSDVEDDTLTVTSVSDDTTNGSLTVNSDGSFNYVPTLNVNGADSFTYKVSDGVDESETITVELNILAVNDAPIPDASSYTFSINETATDGDVVGTISASDIENDKLVYSLTSGDISLFQIDPSSGIITVKGINPLDFETNIQHALTVTITDNGTPIAESSNVAVTINIIDILGDAAITEEANFGLTAFGSLELTGLKTQAQLTDSVSDGTKVYFVGSIDNVDKDIYMVAYNNDGTLDAGFGTNGIKTFDYGANEYAKAIVAIAGDYFITFERNEDSYTEVCFIKVNNIGDINVSFGDSGLRCTTEQKILTINDAVAFVIPAEQGKPLTDIDTVVAVGKVKGATDDDLLVIRVDKDGNFQASTTFVNNVEVVYSPHIMLDITGLGLDDEGIAVYNPHNNEAMIAGNVLTADGDYDIFAWIFNPKNSDGNYLKFNSSTPVTYDVGGIGTDDKVGAIDGENTGFGEHTAHIAGSTVLANGEQDAFIIELDSYAAYVPGFGTNGVAIYDVDGVPSTGKSEFTSYTYNYGDDDLHLTGNVFNGSNYQPFATRILLDGSVDTANYGINGYQALNYGGANAYARAMSLDSGKGMWVPGYVEDGSDNNMIISAFDSSGDAFNNNDIVNGKHTLTHSSTPSDDIVAQVIEIQNGAQKDKYLVASTADDTTNKHIILTRLTSAGALDTTFDSDGHKQIKIGSTATVNGLFELASGNFIVYGNVTEGISTNGFVARIDQNGLLDTGFATNGVYTSSAISATNIQFNQVKADSQGRLIAVGNFESGSNSAFVLRLTAAGALDTLFNTLGTPGYVIGANTDDYITVVIDAIDNIYAGGNRLSGDKDLLMAKYLVTGTLDNAVTVDTNSGIDESVEQLLFDSNNDLYWIGNDLGASAEIVIVKSSTSGVLDGSFSGDGKAFFDMSSLLELGAEAGVTNAVIDSNDNIVVVGYSDISLVKQKKMIGRIKSNGSLDNAFNYNGYFRSPACPNAAKLESIILLNNSSFIVAGQCYINSVEKNNIDISHYTLK